jgi:hypothetical protein
VLFRNGAVGITQRKKMSKKTTYAVMPKQSDNKIVIATSHKVKMGHQTNKIGCGIHNPKPKRLRTRAAQKRAAFEEQ